MEIEEKDLKKLLRTVLSSMYAMDEAVELCDSDNPATAMAFLGGESEKIAQNLYELEKTDHRIRQMLEEMETGEDETVNEVVRGEKEIDELF